MHSAHSLTHEQAPEAAVLANAIEQPKLGADQAQSVVRFSDRTQHPRTMASSRSCVRLLIRGSAT